MKNALTDVIEEYIRLKYRSAENLSRRAGLAGNTVRNVLQSGSGSAATLMALAPLLDRTAAEMFTLVGWLPETEEGDRLTPLERRLVDEFRKMDESGQAFLLRGLGIEMPPGSR